MAVWTQHTLSSLSNWKELCTLVEILEQELQQLGHIPSSPERLFICPITPFPNKKCQVAHRTTRNHVGSCACAWGLSDTTWS
eukprot:12458500-Ditylum_brightwellii.AAC.2